uniref:Thioredoxin domain-containing protein n=1 Tax=viral metagenome TaxID=1070528 RepID=A0A6C0I5X3_9ZZZZ
MSMTTLNHFNKRRHKLSRNKTYRKNKHGGKPYYDFHPGQNYNFDKKSNNLDRLNDFMKHKGKTPWVIRHYRKTCPHCKDFEELWRVIERRMKGHPLYGVANLDDYATDYVANNYPDYPRVNGVPTVVVVDINGVPIEHTGPNTLEAIEKFLNEHGLKIKIVPIEEENESTEMDDYDAAGPGAAGLGAGLGAAGLGAAGLSAGFDSASGLEPTSRLGAGLESTSGVDSEAPKSILSNVKETVSNIDEKIKSGLGKVSETFTKSIDFNNLFASSVDTTPAPAPAATNDATAVTDAATTAANAFPAPPADVNALALAPPPPPPPAPIAENALAKNNNNAVPQMPSGGKRGKKTRRKSKQAKRRTKRRTKRHAKRSV